MTPGGVAPSRCGLIVRDNALCGIQHWPFGGDMSGSATPPDLRCRPAVAIPRRRETNPAEQFIPGILIMAAGSIGPARGAYWRDATACNSHDCGERNDGALGFL